MLRKGCTGARDETALRSAHAVGNKVQGCGHKHEILLIDRSHQTPEWQRNLWALAARFQLSLDFFREIRHMYRLLAETRPANEEPDAPLWLI